MAKSLTASKPVTSPNVRTVTMTPVPRDRFSEERLLWPGTVRDAKEVSSELLTKVLDALGEKQKGFWFPDGIYKVRVVVGPVEVEVSGSK